MKYSGFEEAMSPERMREYMQASGNTKRVMTLYRMGLDGASLMFGLDHVNDACSKIMCL